MYKKEDYIKTLICLLLGIIVTVGSASIHNIGLENATTISEDSLLSEYSNLAFRQDPYTLCFALESGDTLCFCDSVSYGDMTVWEPYRLYDYLPDANYFTVYKYGFEFFLFILVNRNNGYRTYAVSPPVQSPDGNRLLCAWSSPVNRDFYQDGIQIFRIESDSLVMEFSRTFCGWYPERVRWLSDSTVAYSRLPSFSSDSTLEGGTINLDATSNWIPEHPDHWSTAYRGGIQLF